jgi:serine/threonine protein kinase
VTPELWQKVKTVLDAALDLDAGERERYVLATCQDDAALRLEVLSLIEAATEVAEFIDQPLCRLIDDAPEIEAGRRLGAYRVEREIDRGGMGVVYLGSRADQAFEREVAIKVLRRGLESSELAARFQQERQLLARLVHPNIAVLLDGGTEPDGISYIVMEHVEGVTLDEHCELHAPSERERLRLFRTVCGAVHFAHQRLIVHGDLKPGNILVTAEGEPKLLDFGISRLVDASADEVDGKVKPRWLVMTRRWAAPEQLRGEPITTASDVYNLGLLLHCLLAGALPPSHLTAATPDGPSAVTAGPATGAMELAAPAAPAAPAPAPARKPLPHDLAAIVARALQKDTGQRYASAQALGDDVERYLQTRPVAARRSDGWRYPARLFVKRHRPGVTAAATAAVLLVSLAIVTTVLWRTALHNERRATRNEARATRIASFLQDLFTVPDPGRSHGETVTAREILDRGSQQIRRDLRQEPETRAALMETMGQVYINLGLYAPALELETEAVKLRRETLGNDAPQLAESLHSLGNVLRKMDDDDAAEPHVREAVAIQRRNAHGGDTPELARGLINLAALLQAKGALTEAERLFREILAMKRRLHRGDHRDLTMGLQNLAHLLQEERRLAEAEPLYREALAMQRRLAGTAPDPTMALVINNLGTLREERGDFPQAERLYRQALAMRQKLGMQPQVAVTLNNLAQLREKLGDAPGAEQLYRQALAIYDQRPAETVSLNRAIFLRNLASLLAARDPAQAERLAREALGIFQHLPRSGWRTADAESVLGGCLAALGRHDEAAPLLAASYRQLRKLRGDDEPQTRQALARLRSLVPQPPRTGQNLLGHAPGRLAPPPSASPSLLGR